jgi:hypothetical protein
MVAPYWEFVEVQIFEEWLSLIVLVTSLTSLHHMIGKVLKKYSEVTIKKCYQGQLCFVSSFLLLQTRKSICMLREDKLFPYMYAHTHTHTHTYRNKYKTLSNNLFITIMNAQFYLHLLEAQCFTGSQKNFCASLNHVIVLLVQEHKNVALLSCGKVASL